MTITGTARAGLPAVCHYCHGPLLASHRHVLAAQERAVFCACPDCSELFHREVSPGPARPGRALAPDHSSGLSVFSPRTGGRLQPLVSWR
jgi:hypothetical protein